MLKGEAMAQGDEKLKILQLMQILLEETDPDHPQNATQLCDRMKARYEHAYNRKTVYADVERLRRFGLEIESLPAGGYYVAKRDFELPELKLLVDAVQSSRFITAARSEELIRKLERQTSRANAKYLQRQVYIYNRAKAENDAIYQNVDALHGAVRDNRQILFKYCEWTVGKELVRKKGGADYRVSPWALTWADDNYYLVAYETVTGRIKHYRVDKMQEIRILRERRQGRELFEKFDLAAFSRKTFGMFGGRDRQLTLEAENRLAGVVIDRFGTNLSMAPAKDGRFRAIVTVTVSPQFFGWLAGIGKGIRIAWPEDARDEYRDYLRAILEDDGGA